VRCLDRATGKEIWNFPTRGKVDSSPVICGDSVVVASDDGRLYLLALDTGKQRWSYEIGESIPASPAVADGRIVIGSEDGKIYCFGEKR
jgi:outer membrane protein assembly factor BamB